MKDIQQLIKKNSQEGRYEDIFPKTFIDAVLDKESGVTLTDILAMFNMLFLSYNGSRSQTRLQVPSSLRREGLWVTYVLYDKTVVTEWYSAEAIDDTTFGDSANWRDGSNALVGDISISSDGYWVINGEVTNIKAQGEAGITPILRVGSNNHLQVSYTNGSSYVDVSSNPVFTQFRVSNNKLQQSTDLGESWSNISEELAYKFRESGNKIQMSKDLGNTWEDVSDYIAAWFRFTGTTGSSQADNVGKIQISRDNGATWSDLSGEFTNSLHIKGYVATVGALPSTAVQGNIYGVGPTYDTSDTEHTNPIYQLYVKNSTGWVNNGRFTSIAAGVVQTTGTSTTEVMSQDAVTRELTDLELGVIYDVSAHNDGAVFESLSTLLGSANLSTLIPTSVRYGGVGIRFIQGSVPNTDNKYVQYRLTADDWSTNTEDWEKIGNVSWNPDKTADNSQAIANARYALDLGLLSNDLQEIEFTSGYWVRNNTSVINPTPTAEASYSYAIVPCQEGDVFVIHGHGSTNARLWAFCDSNYNNLEMSAAEYDAYNDVLIAPSNASYLIINIQHLGNQVSYKGKRFIDKMPCRIVSNGSYKLAIVDSDGNVIIGVDYKGDVYNYTKHIFTKADLNTCVINSNYWMLLCDGDNKCIFAIDNEGNFILNSVPDIIQRYVDDSIRESKIDIISNNLDKEPALYAAAYKTPFYRYTRLPNSNPLTALYKKKFVIAWGSDFHGDAEAFARFVQFINHYSDIIDCGITTGDLTIVTPLDSGFADTYGKYAPLSRVPILATIGNHEVTGNTETLALLNSINDSDTLFIQPYPSMYDSKGNGAYYYKDFTNTYSGFKFRVIVLNDYEMPRIVAGGKWETIDYDGTLSTYDNSHTYSAGDKCNLDGYSYKALTSTVGNTPNRTYIYNITGRYISQEQADWLVATLNNTPSDYKIIVCSHMALDAIVDSNNKFTSSKAYNATSYAQNGFILTDILNAFINKTTLQQTYSLKEPTSSTTTGNTIAGYDVEIDADFSQAVAVFYCSISGHSHTDFTGKSQHLGTPSFVITESGHLYNMDDLVKFGIKSIDCFNILGFDEEGVDFVRIGCDITTDMEKRDFMRFLNE